MGVTVCFNIRNAERMVCMVHTKRLIPDTAYQADCVLLINSYVGDRAERGLSQVTPLIHVYLKSHSNSATQSLIPISQGRWSTPCP